MSEHKAAVTWQRAWGEWRSECACGWVGSYWRSKQSAQLEAEEHVSTETHP